MPKREDERERERERERKRERVCDRERIIAANFPTTHFANRKRGERETEEFSFNNFSEWLKTNSDLFLIQQL